MNPLMEQLHDIEGLDSIGIWPLAIGWWVLMGIGIMIVFVMFSFLIRWIAFKRSWKNDTFKKLAYLEKNLSDATAKETVIILSEYLRRIALKRFSRRECAGLMEESWLKWLSKHDPKEFNWEKEGRILIEVPYAPLNLETAVQDCKVMQDLDLESLTSEGDHSQKVKAPSDVNDYDSRDCVNLQSSTAVSRLNKELSAHHIKELIQAARSWVR